MFKLLTSIVFLSAMLVPMAATAAPDEPTASAIRNARVRAADPRSATLLMQGLERSDTLRELVNQLERRDVIVYIEMHPALRKRLSGTMTWLASTKEHRYVRISINPELSTDMAIATIGHELQHALEVANAPEIVCERTLTRFYQDHRGSNRVDATGWDTEAARVAGGEVRRELAASAGSRRDRQRATQVADSIQQLHPDDWMVVYRRARGMLPP